MAAARYTRVPPERAPGVVSSRSSRRGAMLLVGLALSLLVVARCPGATDAQTYRFEKPPKILVLRGLCEVFSLGMNDLTKKLSCLGYDVKVTSWTLALAEAQCDEGQPLVVIGHSLGGRACAWVSRKLMSCGERVPLIIIVDANLIQSIPANVDRCLNLYVTNKLGLFHGSPVTGESPDTEIINWDISESKRWLFEGGVDHFDIDATPWVHQIIIDEIATSFPRPVRAAEPRVVRTHRARRVRLDPACELCRQPTPCGCNSESSDQWLLGGARVTRTSRR